MRTKSSHACWFSASRSPSSKVGRVAAAVSISLFSVVVCGNEYATQRNCLLFPRPGGRDCDDFARRKSAAQVVLGCSAGTLEEHLRRNHLKMASARVARSRKSRNMGAFSPVFKANASI